MTLLSLKPSLILSFPLIDFSCLDLGDVLPHLANNGRKLENGPRSPRKPFVHGISVQV